MGTRFRKSIKVAPGVRATIGKKGASLSVGTKGARYTVNTSGRKTTTVGVPGTGVSYVSTSSPSKHRSTSSSGGAVTLSPKKCKVYGIIFLILATISLLIGLPTLSMGGWIFLIIGLPCLLLGVSYLKKGRALKEDAAQEITSL
jgi:hypothetical protein